MEFCYRFRSTDALLDGWQELQNQEIYFAAPDQLNDPIEGFKDVFWDGDSIVWSNLIKHYLLCLEHAIILAAIAGRDYKPEMSRNLVFSSAINLPTQQFKEVHSKVCEAFFSDGELKTIPELLATRGHPIRREELMFYIHGLHPRALACVISALQDTNLLSDSTVTTPPESVAKARVVTDMLQFLRQNTKSDKTLARNSFRSTFTVARHISQQQEILMRLQNSPVGTLGWQSILIPFPEQYVLSLDRIIYFDWYAACFVADHNHAAMWGNYGDGHKGVCLKFRTTSGIDGAPCLKLRRVVGWSSGAQGASRTYNNVDHPFHEVTYVDKFVEVDFFRSIGRVAVAALQRDWYADESGNVSRCSNEIFSNEEKWRSEYWKRFQSTIVTKLSDWRHESEHRLILHSPLGGFADTKDRKLTYNFSDLSGIIFGINTGMDEKLKIIRIISEKCKEIGRKNFEFSQAYYSADTGRIESHTLDLLVPI